MRIPATHSAHAAWPMPRASTARAAAGDAAPPATDGPTATPTSNGTSSGGPPGLQRVLQRLQALPADTRTPGQQQALTRIERNLQRYLEHQGLASGTASLPEQPPLTPKADSMTAPDPTLDLEAASSNVTLGEPPLPTQALLNALPG